MTEENGVAELVSSIVVIVELLGNAAEGLAVDEGVNRLLACITLDDGINLPRCCVDRNK